MTQTIKTKRSKEEVFLDKLAKEEAKAGRLAAKAIRDEQIRIAKENKLKPEPTEEELVKRYVNRTIKNSQYHGRVDTQKFKDLDSGKTVSKNLWMDFGFYFSVVFQSSRQKLEFLEKWEQIHPGLVDENYENFKTFKIINGLKLAECLGIKLSQENSEDYPQGSIDLIPFILDDIKTQEN